MGKSKSTSTFQVKEFPGVFGTPESARIAGQAEQLLGATPYQTPEAPSLAGLLERELTQPSFAPTTESEQALLSQISEMTQGASALRGLGPATQASLAQTLAPALVQQRQQRVSNLQQALGGQLQQRAQDIQSGLGIGSQQAQTIALLMELAGMAMPQRIGGTTSTSTGPSALGQIAAGAATGYASGLCWVADELYGVNATKTHLARFYANNNDNFFLRLYGKYGKSWAKFLSKHKGLHFIVRPIWDRMAKKGAKMILEVI